MNNILLVKLGLIVLGITQWTTVQCTSCTVTSKSVMCENADSFFLSNIPSESIEEIKIVNSNLTLLSEADFSKFTNVNEITIEKSSVPDRVLNFMLSITTLEILRIRNCNLLEKDLPVLRGAKSLVKLSLEGNQLTRVKRDIFNSLSHLEEIDLSYNEISEIEVTAFKDLPVLKKIDLSHNRLTDSLGLIIEKRFFNSLSRLEEMDLSYNEIFDVEVDALESLPALRLLDLSHNRLGESNPRIEQGVFQNLSRLEGIDLSHNNISEVESGALDGLYALRRLDLSHNRLGDGVGHGIKKGVFDGLSHVLEIDLSHNEISAVDEEAFSGLPSLSRLDLSHNRLGQGFSPAFLSLPRGCVLCARAGQKACPADACPPPAAVDALWRALPGPGVLRLHGNPVCQAVASGAAAQERCVASGAAVEEGDGDCRVREGGTCSQHACRDGFLQDACSEHGKCETSLSSVLCKGQSGNFIPSGWSAHVPVIYIIESNMSSLSAGDFAAFTSLRAIYIDSCNLTFTAGNNMFASLKNLRNLEIINSNVSEEVFSLMSSNNLVKLSLEGNKLTHIKKEFFANLSRLEEIDLRHNEISAVDPDAFEGMSGLRRLDLSHNGLSDDFDLSLPDGCRWQAPVATCRQSAMGDSQRQRRGGPRDDGGGHAVKWDGVQAPLADGSGAQGAGGGSTRGQDLAVGVIAFLIITCVLLLLLLVVVVVAAQQPQIRRFFPKASESGDDGEGGSGNGAKEKTEGLDEQQDENTPFQPQLQDSQNDVYVDIATTGAVPKGFRRWRYTAGLRRRKKHGAFASSKRIKENNNLFDQLVLRFTDMESRLMRHVKDMMAATKGGGGGEDGTMGPKGDREESVPLQTQLQDSQDRLSEQLGHVKDQSLTDMERRLMGRLENMMTLAKESTLLMEMLSATEGAGAGDAGKGGGGDSGEDEKLERTEQGESLLLQAQRQDSQNDSSEVQEELLLETWMTVERQIESELVNLEDVEKAQADGDRGNDTGTDSGNAGVDSKLFPRRVSVTRSVQRAEKWQDSVMTSIRSIERRLLYLTKQIAKTADSDRERGSELPGESRTDGPEALEDEDLKQLQHTTPLTSQHSSRSLSTQINTTQEIMKELEESFAEEMKQHKELVRAMAKTKEKGGRARSVIRSDETRPATPPQDGGKS